VPTERWTVGDITVTKIVESENWSPLEILGEILPTSSRADIEAMTWLQPDYVRDGTIGIGIYSFLVETPDRTVVVDTGVGNAKLRSAPRFHMLDTPFLDDFQTACALDDVDAVVGTHLHVDHVGWNTRLVDEKWVPTFPNAAYYFVKSEYDHWEAVAEGGEDALGYAVIDGTATFEDSVKPIVVSGRATFVGPDETITPGVSLIPSHGHTPGHVSVLIESRGQSAVITGDLMHTPCQIGYPEWSAIYDANQDASAATRRAFLDRFAETSTIIIGTHFGTPTGGLVQRDGAAFRLSPAG
jgi:glyoxylase-like metal-dependent hydrolase (beta-lactamase superfamily II)